MTGSEEEVEVQEGLDPIVHPGVFHCPSDTSITKLPAQGTNVQLSPVWSQTYIGFFQRSVVEPTGMGDNPLYRALFWAK